MGMVKRGWVADQDIKLSGDNHTYLCNYRRTGPLGDAGCESVQTCEHCRKIGRALCGDIKQFVMHLQENIWICSAMQDKREMVKNLCGFEPSTGPEL